MERLSIVGAPSRRRLYNVKGAQLPVFRTSAGPAVGLAGYLRRVRSVYRREHGFLAEELVVVLFDFRVESRVVIRIPGGRVGTCGHRIAHNPFVQASDSARPRGPLQMSSALFGLS